MIPKVGREASARILAADATSRRKHRGRTYRDNRARETRGMPLHGGGCWCGEKANHDWPGKDQGAPHPRDGHPYRE